MFFEKQSHSIEYVVELVLSGEFDISSLCLASFGTQMLTGAALWKPLAHPLAFVLVLIFMIDEWSGVLLFFVLVLLLLLTASQSPSGLL
jgi:hypothetical protein